MTTTGRVVAMASYPSYNPSVWTGGISKQEFNYLFGSAHGEPILNRATQGEYAPGSTFKVTTTAAAVADGYSIDGTYNCPASVTIGGHKFINDGNPNLGPMSLPRRRWSSPATRSTTSSATRCGCATTARPTRWPARTPRCRRCRRWSWPGASAMTPASTCPSRAPAPMPTRQWLYNYWKQYKNSGARTARQSGSYVQQIEYQDCRTGYVWEPGQAAIAAIGQGYVTRHAAAARRRLRGAGQRRHAVQPADRQGADQPGRQGGQEDQPAGDPPPAGVRLYPRLHAERAARRGDIRHRGQRVRRLPAQQGLRRGQDGNRPGVRQAGHVGVRLVRARATTPSTSW